MNERVWKALDRSSWPDGPWAEEPDGVEWIDAAGLLCTAVRDARGFWWGFVCVDRDHPLFGKSSTSCVATPSCKDRYCDSSLSSRSARVGSLYETRAGLPKAAVQCPDPTHDHVRLWHLGFQCSGSDEIRPGDPKHTKRIRKQGITPVYRTLDDVRDRLGEIARFLEELTATLILVPGHGTEYARATEKARRRALDDWEHRRAAVHSIGLPIEGAHVDGETGLYVVSSGCIIDGLEMASSKAYDATIRHLVARHGIPEWAPIRRIPTKAEALGALALADPIASYDGVPFRHRGITYTIFEDRTMSPSLWRAWPEKRVLLFAGDESATEGRVDVVDVACGRWLATLRLDRRQLGPFPWDEGRQTFEVGASVCAGCGAPSATTADGMFDWIVCCKPTFGCGLVCPRCAADHDHTGPWRRKADLEPGEAFDPAWNDWSFELGRYTYTRLGHELVVQLFEGHHVQEILRSPVEIAISLVGLHLVVLFRFAGTGWYLSRFSPFRVPADLRAVPSPGEGSRTIDLFFARGWSFVVEASLRIHLPPAFAQSLEEALVEQSWLDWPGATAFEEAKSRLESRKNDPESFLGSAIARCEVELESPL